MANISLGRAYWIYMNSLSPIPWNVVGTNGLTPAVFFTNDWNLVGIPVGAPTLPEPVNILSVLAVSGLNYDVLLKWEAGQYKRFTPDYQDVDDFTGFDPNKGHWVHITSNSFLLQPRLLSSVRADDDVEPKGIYPSFQDLVNDVGGVRLVAFPPAAVPQHTDP